MMYLLNKIASYMLFVKLQRSIEHNEWFLTILYLTWIEFLVVCPFIFFIAVYISQFMSLVVVVPIIFFGSLLALYMLNKKVYEQSNKAIVYQLAYSYDKSHLNKIRLLVLGVFLSACSFFISGMHLISRF